MGSKLVETVLPVRCKWCKRHLHVVLGVRNLVEEEKSSLVLCPSCDAPTLDAVRQRVVGYGRLEQRDDVLVWVADRSARPGATDPPQRPGPGGFLRRAGKRRSR